MLHCVENDDRNHTVFAQRPPGDAAVSAGIERLLKTNIQPLDIERTQLENAFAAHNEYAAKLVRRQANVEAARRELEVESRAVEEHMSKIKTVLHPVRSLPNEILYEILSPIIRSVIPIPFVSGSQVRPAYPSSLDVKRHPLWIFSHVCRRWRDYILSLPRLWSYIHVVLGDTPLNTFKSSFLVRLLVSRSGDYPLHISFRDEDKSLRTSSSLSELFLHCPRWKTLQLRTRVSSLRIFDCGSQSFSILESIQFSIQPSYSPDWSDDSDSDEDEAEMRTPAPYQGFCHAPNLRRVHLSDPWSYIEPHIIFPWNQITHLVLLSIRSPQVAKLLPLVNQLIDAKLWLTDRTEAFDNFAHDTLRVLTVRCTSSVRSLIASLRLPALESLSISNAEDDMYVNLARSNIYEASLSTLISHTLQGLVSQTGSCIRTLSVSLFAARIGTVRALHGLRALLESTPFLESLSIRLIGHESMDEMCLLLQSKLVPQLSQLSIWATHGAELSDILIGMMESRRGELKDVELRGVSKAPDAVLAQFDKFVQDGMVCKISYIS